MINLWYKFLNWLEPTEYIYYVPAIDQFYVATGISSFDGVIIADIYHEMTYLGEL